MKFQKKKPIIKSFSQNEWPFGATSQIRTGDPRITSAMLWPAELKWQNVVTPTGIEPMSPPWKGDVLTAWPRGHKYVEI